MRRTLVFSLRSAALGLLAFLGACDAAKADYNKCASLEPKDPEAALASCEAAVKKASDTESGKAAIAMAKAIRERLDKLKAEEEAKKRAAAEEEARKEAAAAEARERSEVERIRPLLLKAEPILKECLPLWRKSDEKQRCQERVLVAARGDVWRMLQECGDFERINAAEQKLRNSLKSITDQIGSTRPEVKVLESRLKSACDDGEYTAPE